ncbi:N-terminal acetyltransferase B complex subunit NAA25 -like protein [Toxocara canis]|uniref:N-terminal acetyltransferase B complex subunit NAA25-like protein n=1 Tax=Toxocara canis TaxID=6265 RepID=A0A0B2VH49_TOXCA|nr:N-terminal acetyltransferase B complex subunit NAA25 -like protein [Toxocara canis]
MKQETCTVDEKNTLIDRLVERILSLMEKTRTLGTSGRVRGIYLARLTLITRLLEQQLALRTQLGTLQLGYLLFGLLEQYGRFNAGIIYYTELSVLFDQTEKEISECLTTAYKNGNFAQVPRLVKFLSKITKSVIAIGADIQSRALSACFAVEKIEHVVDTLKGDQEPIDFSTVEDNRDLNVIPSLDSGNPSELIEEVKQRSYFEQVDSMKLRDLLLRCVASIAAPTSSSSQITSLLTQLKKHCEHCQQTYTVSIARPELMQSPPAVFLGSFVNGAHIPLIDALLSSAIKLVKIVEETQYSQDLQNASHSIDKKLEEELPDVDVIQELVLRVAEEELPSAGSLRMHTRIRHCSCALQTFALASIAIKLIERRVESVVAASAVHRSKRGASKPELMQSPPAVFLGSFVNGAHIPLIDALLSSAIKLVKIVEETQYSQDLQNASHSIDKKLEEELPDVDVIQELVLRVAEEELPSAGSLRMHTRIRHCSCALQTFALASIAIKLIERRVESVVAASAVHRSKRGASKGQRKHTALLRVNEVRASLHKGIRAVDDILANCQNSLNADDLIPDISSANTEDFSKILLSQKADVDSAIVASYACSLSDMRETVQRVLNPPWA